MMCGDNIDKLCLRQIRHVVFVVETALRTDFIVFDGVSFELFFHQNLRRKMYVTYRKIAAVPDQAMRATSSSRQLPSSS